MHCLSPEGEELEEKADRFHGSPASQLTGKRHGKLFDELGLSGLESWTPELADAAGQLLAKYHDVFLIRSSRCRLYHSTEHIIKLTDDIPFKEQFRQIPPVMVKEVRNHLKEILESGTIRPSQSAWCNVMVLVWEKGWRLAFLYQFFCPPECSHKKRIPTPSQGLQEMLESLVGAGHFSLPRSQI